MTTATTPIIVPGHGLQREGRGHRQLAGCIACDLGAGKREGHGLCSCGATSPHETSDAARKRWHREHKETIEATRSGSLHRCPTSGRTGRSVQIDRLIRKAAGTKVPDRKRVLLSELGGHLVQMDLYRLCPVCGYPLDNSAPHPDA